MTQRSKNQLKYTAATYAIERLTPSKDAMRLCEQVSNGQISADTAVEKLLQIYDVSRGRSNG